MRLTCLLVLLTLLPSCGDDDDGGGSDGAVVDARANGADASGPVGGWTASGLFACFAADGRADFGDRIGEVADTPCCSWTPNGAIDFGGQGTGTWRLTGTQLVLQPDPPCGTECAAVTYIRASNLPCFP